MRTIPWEGPDWTFVMKTLWKLCDIRGHLNSHSIPVLCGVDMNPCLCWSLKPNLSEAPSEHGYGYLTKGMVHVHAWGLSVRVCTNQRMEYSWRIGAQLRSCHKWAQKSWCYGNRSLPSGYQWALKRYGIWACIWQNIRPVQLSTCFDFIWGDSFGSTYTTNLRSVSAKTAPLTKCQFVVP